MECILRQREDERRSGAVSFSDIAFDQMQKQCVCVVNIMGGGYQNAILHYLRQSHNHHDKMIVIEILNKLRASSPNLDLVLYSPEDCSKKLDQRQNSLDNSIPEALTWEDLEIHEDQENFVELDNALSAIKIYE